MSQPGRIKTKDCTPIKFKNVGINQCFISNDDCPVLNKIMDSFYIKVGTKEGSFPWFDPNQEVYLIPSGTSNS